jgi:hypothetical protein
MASGRAIEVVNGRNLALKWKKFNHVSQQFYFDNESKTIRSQTQSAIYFMSFVFASNSIGTGLLVMGSHLVFITEHIEDSMDKKSPKTDKKNGRPNLL